MRRVSFFALFALICASSLSSVRLFASTSPSALITGEIESAQFAIATPTAPQTWNRKLLLIAHGYRPESAPIVADLNPTQAAYATLLAEGWIIGKTSYRRNGIIVDDAITDLNNLYQKIVHDYGSPALTLLEGDSMGGTIATLLAETENPPYDGLIAIGAALDLKEPNGSVGVTIKPLQPLLFVANRSEIAGPRAYLEQVVSQPASDEVLPPALFRIDRDGHVNVNQAERLYAIRAMTAWLEKGARALPAHSALHPHDATQIPAEQPSAVVFDEDHRGFTATVTDVSAIYGNVWLNAQPTDFAAIGLDNGLWAQLEVGAQTYRFRHGRDFSDVERGQWVAFPNADGNYWLSRNWANAAETAGLKVGDTVHIRRFDSATQ